MAEDLIDHYVDREGLKGDTAFILEEINKALEAIKKFNAAKPSLDAAKGYDAAAQAIKKQKDAQEDLGKSSDKLNDIQGKTASSLKDLVDSIKGAATGNNKLSDSYDELIKLSVANQLATKGLAQARKDLDKAFKEGIISADDYTSILVEIKKKETEITVSNLDLNRAIRNTEKGFQAAEGSLNALRAELNLSLQSFDRLSEADKGSEFGLELKANINSLTDKIKEQEESTQRFQRNVGNYQGSAKILVDALGSVEKKLESLRQKQENLNRVNQDAASTVGFKSNDQRLKELNQVTAEIKDLEKEAQALNTITSSPKFLNVAGKTGDATVEIRGFTKALVELEQKGLGSSDFAIELRKHLAELTDQVADTKDEIKALSSDTHSFDQLTSSVNLLTNTYQTFVGIQALSGEQSAETEEVIKKLVAVQAVSNGLQEIGEVLTKRGTLANKAYTVVQGLMATATDTSATATVRLAAATKLLLGGLILGVIVLLVIKLKEWSEAANSIITKQKVLNQVTKAAADSYGQEKSKLDTLIATIKTEGISRKAKFDSLKQLQEAYPGYFDNIKTEADLNNKLEEAYQKAAKGILLKAQAEAASNLLAENTSKKLKTQIDFNEQEEKSNKILSEGLLLEATKGKAAVDQYKKTFDNLKKIRKQAFDDENKKIDETNKFLIKSIQDSSKQIEDLGGKVTGGGKDDKKKDTNKDLEKELAARFELEKINQQKIIDLHKAMAESEGLPQNVRIKARLQQFEEERKLAIMQRDFELSQEKLSASERELIVSKSNDQIVKLESDAAIGIISIRKDANEQIKADAEATNQWSKDAIKKQTEDQIKDINAGLEAKLNAIEAQGDAELKAATDQYAAGELSKERFEEKKLRIENKTRQESLLAEIDHQQKLLDIYIMDPEARAKAEQELTKLKKKLLDQEVKDVQTAADKKLIIEQKIHEKLKELGNELKELAFTFLTAGIDRQKNEIQDQIDALEAKKQKDIEVANQSIANETERANAISVIEARSAAEKERLERKKRQLDQERARYERVKNIADIIQSTAAAVVGALGAKPWGPQNIALAAIVGAIGAAQIARVLATPLPKFYGGKSKENKYEGMAVVGDGGRSEKILREDGSVEITPNKPTLTYLKRNDIVLPDARQSVEHDFRLAVANTGKLVNHKIPEAKVIQDPNAERRHREMLRTIKNKREVHIKGISKRDIILKYGYDAWRYL